MARLNWSDQAIIDLTNIAEFIAKDSVRYSKITVTRIRTTARTLQKYPLSGRKVPETDIENIRELIRGNYRIFYNVFSPDRIDIITIHHSAMRLIIKELKNFKG